MGSKQMTTGIGTPSHMAPELLKFTEFKKFGTANSQKSYSGYDFGIDIWSFGCVLFEIMTQKELYEKLETAKDIKQFVMEGKREKIPKEIIQILGIPQEYLKLMARCWAHDSSQRPHFKDIISRLEQIAKII